MALFIVNPAAGHGRAGNFWRRVQPLIVESFGGYNAAWTEGPAHASELAAKAIEGGETRVIAVGGDGTFREVVEGYFLASEKARQGAAVGCLSAGSGCDFARHFGIPKEPLDWVPRLAAAKPQVIDAAEAEWMAFDGSTKVGHLANIAMFGLAGDLAVSMLKSGKPLGGTLSYMKETLAAIFRARPKRMTLELDGRRVEGMFHLVAAANTSMTGGGMRIAPNADPADGLLDFVSVGALSRSALLMNFPKIYRGAHLRIEGVRSDRIRTLRAESDEPVYLNIDGEAAGRLPMSIRVLPKALRVLLP
jgi:diacylglycerol kinase (ATP)